MENNSEELMSKQKTFIYSMIIVFVLGVATGLVIENCYSFHDLFEFDNKTKGNLKQEKIKENSKMNYKENKFKNENLAYLKSDSIKIKKYNINFNKDFVVVELKLYNKTDYPIKLMYQKEINQNLLKTFENKVIKAKAISNKIFKNKKDILGKMDDRLHILNLPSQQSNNLYIAFPKISQNLNYKLYLEMSGKFNSQKLLNKHFNYEKQFMPFGREKQKFERAKENIKHKFKFSKVVN